MLKENLTFNDLPEMVGRLCEKIESLENALKDNLAKQVPVKENLHVSEYPSHPSITKPSTEAFPPSSRASICLSIVTSWTNGWRAEEKARYL